MEDHEIIIMSVNTEVPQNGLNVWLHSKSKKPDSILPHALKEPTHIREKNIWTHETKMNLYQNDAASGTGSLQFID